MDDFRSKARDPKYRRRFEKLLYLACRRGDGDLVAERLSWGIDANCTFARGRTPLIANVRGSSPNAITVRALLEHGADAKQMDETGLTALDYARRKLARLQARPRRRRKSPSLDENDQLRLSLDEQAELDEARGELGAEDYRGIGPENILKGGQRLRAQLVAVAEKKGTPQLPGVGNPFQEIDGDKRLAGACGQRQ